MQPLIGKCPWMGLLLLLSLMLPCGCENSQRTYYSSGPIPAGTPLPALQVSGWLNTGSLPPGDRNGGQVVVVDCWATWCGPCRAAMPHLAKIAARYQPQGVLFLGLTPEPASAIGGIDAFIQTVPGFDWAVGYGANLPIDQIGVKAFPTLIVFDSEGRAIWSGHSSNGLPEVLDRALASR